MGGAQQVAQVDRLGLVVEDRGLHRAVEELVGMAAEELVERVLARDVDREALAAAPRPAPHLAQARDGSRKRRAHRGVQLADVDPELERVRRDHRQQLSRRQPALDVAPLLRRVAGAVRSDPRGKLAAADLLEPHPDEALDQLDPAAAAQEANRPQPAPDELRHELCGLGEHRAAPHRLRVDHGRVPHRDAPPGARGAVAPDDRERNAGEPLGELDRVGDRGRGEHESRVGPVDARHAPQAAEDVCDVRAEDAAVGVRFVDHHPPQPGEHLAPAAVVRQNAHVQHVRVRQDEVGASADRRAVIPRRVAVVDRVAEPAEPELVELSSLVLGQRLGRIEVERPGTRVAHELVEDGKVEAERLPRCGPARHDDASAARGGEGVALVRVEIRDPAGAQRAR